MIYFESISWLLKNFWFQGYVGQEGVNQIFYLGLLGYSSTYSRVFYASQWRDFFLNFDYHFLGRTYRNPLNDKFHFRYHKYVWRNITWLGWWSKFESYRDLFDLYDILWMQCLCGPIFHKLPVLVYYFLNFRVHNCIELCVDINNSCGIDYDWEVYECVWTIAVGSRSSKFSGSTNSWLDLWFNWNLQFAILPWLVQFFNCSSASENFNQFLTHFSWHFHHPFWCSSSYSASNQ